MKLWISNTNQKIDDISMFKYENNGFKMFDKQGSIKMESSAKNIFKINNESNQDRYNIDIFSSCQEREERVTNSLSFFLWVSFS